jgi:hypothetical protein
MSESSTPQTTPAPQSTDELSIEELRLRGARAQELIAELKALFPDHRRYTEEERRHSQGRLRKDEAEMLGVVLDVVDYAPHYFASLADQDEGDDPDRLETTLLRDRLERRVIMGEVADAIEPFTRVVDDTALHYGELVRPVLLSAYRIAKPISKSDIGVANRLAPVVDFYSAPARAAAQTRAGKKNEAK